MYEASYKLKGKIVLAKTGAETPTEKRFMEYLGVYSDDLPSIRISDPADHLRKYKMEENLRHLIQNLAARCEKNTEENKQAILEVEERVRNLEEKMDDSSKRRNHLKV